MGTEQVADEVHSFRDAAMKHGDRVAFLVLACVALGYVIARAALVPMVHDECASVLWFVQPGEWLPGRAHGDANNHFLSSGIGVLLYGVFGTSMLALRLGSVTAFVVYAWAAWRLGEQLRHRRIRWCLLGALLLCPFVLDFFSLFRGYAIELAGWLVALDGLLRYAASRSTRHLALTLSGMLLADASIVALLPVWAILLALLFVLLWTGRDRVHGASRIAQPLLLLVVGLVPIGYAMGIAWELKAAGLLYHGSAEGFFKVTVQSLCHYVLGDASALVAGVVVGLLCFSTAMALRGLLRSRSIGSPLVLAHIVLWSDVLLRIMMSAVMGVNFPEDRAGIHFVPLSLACIALAVDAVAVERIKTEWVALLLLLLPMRALYTMNLDHTVLWPEQSVPARFADRVIERQSTSQRPLVIGGHHQLALAWPMNARWHGRHVPSLQTDGFPDGDHDLRIVDHRWIKEASIGFHAIDNAAGPGLWLLERDTPMRIGAADTVPTTPREGTDEFMELAHLPDSLLRSAETFLDILIPVGFDGRSPDVLLVVEITDSAGSKLLYATEQLSLASDPVGHGPFRYARTMGRMPTAVRAVVYLYNPRRIRLEAGAGSIAIAIRNG